MEFFPFSQSHDLSDDLDSEHGQQNSIKLVEKVKDVLENTYFETCEWNDEQAEAFLLSKIPENEDEEQALQEDVEKVSRIGELSKAPKTCRSAIMIRICWRMICKESQFIELREHFDDENVQNYFRPGPKTIKIIMQGGKTLRGMLLHPLFFAGVRGQPIILFGHSVVNQVRRDLSSQVEWLQKIYKRTVYQDAKSSMRPNRNNCWLPKELFFSVYSRGTGDGDRPHSVRLKQLMDPRESLMQVWFNIWGGSGETVSKMCTMMEGLKGKYMNDESDYEEHRTLCLKDLYVVVDEAHLVFGTNKFHQDLEFHRDKIGKNLVWITATDLSIKIKSFLHKEHTMLVELMPAAPSFHCLKTTYDSSAIEGYEQRDILDMEYNQGAASDLQKRHKSRFPYDNFVPKANRDNVNNENPNTWEEEESFLKEKDQKTLRSVLWTANTLASLARPVLTNDGQIARLAPKSILLHNGFISGPSDSKSRSCNHAHVLFSKFFIAECAEQIRLFAESEKTVGHNKELELRIRKGSRKAWALAFPEYMSSRLLEDDRYPSVFCNMEVLDYLEKNDTKMHDMFKETCRTPESPERERRTQTLKGKVYYQYDLFFSQKMWLDKEPVTNFPNVYRIRFPRGFPLQVRKEMLYLCYCSFVGRNIHHTFDPYVTFNVGEGCTEADYKESIKRHEVQRFAMHPLIELTVGKQLLRQSVSVMSLRKSLQPTHGIIAWDENKKLNFDDLLQGVGRMNGQREARAHYNVACQGTASNKWSSYRPKLSLIKSIYEMVVNAQSSLKTFTANLNNLASEQSVEDRMKHLRVCLAELGWGLQATGKAEITQARPIRNADGGALRKGGQAIDTIQARSAGRAIDIHPEHLALWGVATDYQDENDAESDFTDDELQEDDDDHPSLEDDDNDNEEGRRGEGGAKYKPGDAINRANGAHWLKTVLKITPAKKKKLVVALHNAIEYAENNIDDAMVLMNPYDVGLMVLLENIDDNPECYRKYKDRDQAPLLKEIQAWAKKETGGRVFSSEKIALVAANRWARWSLNKFSDLGVEDDFACKVQSLGPDISDWNWNRLPLNLDKDQCDAWDNFLQFLSSLNPTVTPDGRFQCPNKKDETNKNICIRPDCSEARIRVDPRKTSYFCQKHRLCNRMKNKKVCGFSCLSSQLYCEYHRCACVNCKECEEKGCSSARSTNTDLCAKCNRNAICNRCKQNQRLSESPYCDVCQTPRKPPKKKKRRTSGQAEQEPIYEHETGNSQAIQNLFDFLPFPGGFDGL